MATIALITILFFTLSSSTIHARESQFFAKLSNNPKQTETLNTNQQNPQFTPQTQDTTTGSYGHESGQLPPSTTTTTINNNNLPAYLPENYNPVAYTTPIHSSTQDIPDEFKEPQGYNGENKMYNSQNQDEFVGTNGGQMYNSEKQGMSDTKFLENGRYYYTGDNAYNSPKQGFEDARFTETQDGGNMYNSEKQVKNVGYNQVEEMYNSEKQGTGETSFSTTNNGNMYNTGKQGMSDTRFLEAGKYYYDINMENNANTNVNSRNGYNTQGYYGNNENSYDKYNSNGGYQNQNSYDKYNSNGGYQNQEEFQGEQYNP